MPGKWDRTRVEAGNNYLAVNEINVNLPVSNFIGAVWVRLNGLGGATPVTANLMGIRVRAEIIADGSKVIYNKTMRNGQQDVHYKYGITPELATAGAAGATDMTLPIIFGRYLGDEEFILPAKLFKTLTLRLSFGVVLNANTDLYAATGADLEVDVDQYISNDDPTTKKVIKQVEIQSHVNAGAAVVNRISVPLQGEIMQTTVHSYTTATGAAAAIGTEAITDINNGERRAWAGVFAETENFNLNPFTYAVNGVNVLDYERTGTGKEAINMRPLGAFHIELTEGAVAGTVVLCCNYVMNANEV